MRPTLTLVSCALLLPLTGCAGTIGTPSGDANAPAPSHPNVQITNTAIAAVDDWYTSGGKDVIAILTTDIAGVTNDDLHHNTSSVNTDCVQLAADMNQVQNHDPIPDPQAQQLWSGALKTLNQGSGDCNGGINDNNATELRKGIAEIESAAPTLTAVSRRITAVTG